MPLLGTRQLESLYERKLANQELSLREYDERKTVLESRPSKLILELTQNCNFRCPMCPQSYFEKYKRYDPTFNMSMELYRKVAESLFKTCYFVDLRGFGESVILPYWEEIVDDLENYPLIDWHLVTNLSLPRDRVWEKMVQRGFILGFSCDGATQETFETIRARSHFDKILHNLGVVTDAIRRYGTGFVYFLVTVQRRNLEELPQIIELANRFGVRDVRFKIIQSGPHGEHLGIEPDLLRRSVDASIDRAIDLGVRLSINDRAMLDGLNPEKVARAAAVEYTHPAYNFSAPKADATTEARWQTVSSRVIDTSRVSVHKKCFKPFHYSYIGSDGIVGTCNHMMNPHIMEMGNLNLQTFDEIWNGDSYQFFRASLLTAKPVDSRCAWCMRNRLED